MRLHPSRPKVSTLLLDDLQNNSKQYNSFKSTMRLESGRIPPIAYPGHAQICMIHEQRHLSFTIYQNHYTIKRKQKQRLHENMKPKTIKHHTPNRIRRVSSTICITLVHPCSPCRCHPLCNKFRRGLPHCTYDVPQVTILVCLALVGENAQ